TKNSLVERLSIIAAIEHLTSFLGMWVLTEKGLDKADVDPGMLDLVRWHGAEEVEHRAVAYDVLQYFDTRRFRRVRTYIMIMPTVVVVWARGLSFLMKSDPTLTDRQRKYNVRQVRAVTQRGLFPTAKAVAKASVRYFRKDYHPSKEGSTSLAVAYLASSPAARAASV
ncbi:MAG: metal-dependent hydrolase, partial [Rhodococcus sp. (in: high G+C Gram-positive bacteria)]